MAKGGVRPGAGRKKNSGTYGEDTVAMRIPLSLHTTLQNILKTYKNKPLPSISEKHTISDTASTLFQNIAPHIYQPSLSKLEIPLFSSRVQAGFPSPADDAVERKLDLNEHLIQHPSATFFVRASGDSMMGVGIHSGDILIVDRSLTPRHNHIVIAILNAELTVKRLYRREGKVQLIAENPHYPAIQVPDETNLEIWGVVTSVIHQFGGKS